MKNIRNLLETQEQGNIPIEIIETAINEGCGIIVQGKDKENRNMVADAIFLDMDNYVPINIENAGRNKVSSQGTKVLLIYVNSNGFEPYIESINRFNDTGLRTICVYTKGKYHDFREIRKKLKEKTA